MNIVDVLSRTVAADEVEHKYEYRMTKSNFMLSDDNINLDVQSYGIEIERADYVEGKIVNIERDSVKNISPQRHKVQNLLKLLYDNTVSPIHLIDVLGEYIDEYIIDFDKAYQDSLTC